MSKLTDNLYNQVLTDMRTQDLSCAVFVENINLMRRKNKGAWISGHFTVDGLTVGIKSFNTSVQVLTIDGIHYGSSYDTTVKQYRAFITEAILHALAHPRTTHNTQQR